VIFNTAKMNDVFNNGRPWPFLTAAKGSFLKGFFGGQRRGFMQ
jgi:hypothetical protein